VLFCGAQALGMADIGNPEWVEKGFDYDNQQGISHGQDPRLPQAEVQQHTLSVVGSYTVDAINLPVGAIVVGGDVTTETAFTGSTAFNITVGDSASSNRYLTVTDKTTAARTALTLTGYVGLGENIRLVIAPTVATVTAGKLTLRVQYIVRNRANEAVTV
jgi:hypothetical protein